MVKEIFKTRPNWLGSEVGVVTKTITVPVGTTSVVENNRTIVKSGTIFTSPFYGLLFNDVDITDGAAKGALMVGGYYINAKLPATAASNVTDFAATGLFPITEGTVVRPDFGSDSKTVLSAPTATVAKGLITVTDDVNALYNSIYSVSGTNKVYVTDFADEYTVATVGSYYIKSIGNNINYSDSDFSAVVSVTTLA